MLFVATECLRCTLITGETTSTGLARLWKPWSIGFVLGVDSGYLARVRRRNRHDTVIHRWGWRHRSHDDTCAARDRHSRSGRASSVGRCIHRVGRYGCGVATDVLRRPRGCGGSCRRRLYRRVDGERLCSRGDHGNGRLHSTRGLAHHEGRTWLHQWPLLPIRVPASLKTPARRSPTGVIAVRLVVRRVRGIPGSQHALFTIEGYHVSHPDVWTSSEAWALGRTVRKECRNDRATG